MLLKMMSLLIILYAPGHLRQVEWRLSERGTNKASSHLATASKCVIDHFVFVHSSSFRLALPEYYRVPVLALAHIHGC